MKEGRKVREGGQKRKEETTVSGVVFFPPFYSTQCTGTGSRKCLDSSTLVSNSLSGFSKSL